MAKKDEFAIPRGSLVLLTGANGYLGAHIAEQLIQRGYRIRGVVRDTKKHAWLIDFFEGKYGEGVMELVQVVNMTAEGAFDEAVKGVSAVAHTVSVVTFDPDPNYVVTEAINGAMNILKSSYAEPSVRRFVLTSSSQAVQLPKPGRPKTILTEASWNDEAIEAAWADPPYTMERAGAVYGASKAQTEQEVWKFYEEHKEERPDFVVNTVLPDVTLGRVVAPQYQGYPSSGLLVAALWMGELKPMHHAFPCQHFVDSEDVGVLHTAALILPHVQGQRIFGSTTPFNWDMVLHLLQRRDPSRGLPAQFSGAMDATVVEPRHKAEQLLRDLGRPGWTSLEQSVANNLEGVERFYS